MYELRNACQNDISVLIKYKLLTIYEYANNISEEDDIKIRKYVNESVPKLLNEYKMVVVKGQTKGCLLVTDYKDGKLIDEIYLEEEYRGKGIGTSLIKNILNKHNVVYLWVYKKNEKAIKLYEKLKFNKVLETETRYLMRYKEN